MKNTPYILALAALLITPALADPGTDDSQTVWGTAGIDIKGAGGIGISLCTTLGLPLVDCGEPLSQRGIAFFDTTSWNSGAGSNEGRLLRVWAEQTHGVGTGFQLSACSDLDDNFICGGSNDLYESANSANIDTNDDGCQKDEKDCDAWNQAGLTVCVPIDDDGSFDNVIVFISNYVDAETSQNDDVGVGVSEGLYEVSLDYGDFVANC